MFKAEKRLEGHIKIIGKNNKGEQLFVNESKNFMTKTFHNLITSTLCLDTSGLSGLNGGYGFTNYQPPTGVVLRGTGSVASFPFTLALTNNTLKVATNEQAYVQEVPGSLLGMASGAGVGVAKDKVSLTNFKILEEGGVELTYDVGVDACIGTLGTVGLCLSKTPFNVDSSNAYYNYAMGQCVGTATITEDFITSTCFFKGVTYVAVKAGAPSHACAALYKLEGANMVKVLDLEGFTTTHVTQACVHLFADNNALYALDAYGTLSTSSKLARLTLNADNSFSREDFSVVTTHNISNVTQDVRLTKHSYVLVDWEEGWVYSVHRAATELRIVRTGIKGKQTGTSTKTVYTATSDQEEDLYIATTGTPINDGTFRVCNGLNGNVIDIKAVFNAGTLTVEDIKHISLIEGYSKIKIYPKRAWCTSFIRDVNNECINLLSFQAFNPGFTVCTREAGVDIKSGYFNSAANGGATSYLPGVFILGGVQSALTVDVLDTPIQKDNTVSLTIIYTIK